MVEHPAQRIVTRIVTLLLRLRVGVAARWEALRTTRLVDPVTGDQLTSLEYATRQAQQLLRSPWFILAFNVVTLSAMLTGWREPWNYFASWLAIMVEWIVGTFMFGQTKRDALVMREIRSIARHIETLTQQTLGEVEQLEEQERGSGEHAGEHAGR